MRFLFAVSLIFLISCSQQEPFKESKTFAGGKVVTAATLNLGRTTYMEYCVSCHGVNGDGNGVSAKGMYPPPRNFKQGLYKFGQVVAGELPHDDHLAHIIKNGLEGTAMLPWDISEKRLYAVVQYIKTFAPQVWEEKGAVLGKSLKLAKDPYGLARKNSAIEKGKEVYHMTAQCTSCHRGYLTKDELSSLWEKNYGEKLAAVPADFYQLKQQETEYGYKNLPPDYTWHYLRSVRSVKDVYIRLKAGISGTSMPSWDGVLTDTEMWAASYYVYSLKELKDKPGRYVLMAKLGK